MPKCSEFSHWGNYFQDETWQQLGAPNTNRDRPGINPAFPAYPSGHATFGTAVLEVVKLALHQPGNTRDDFQPNEICTYCSAESWVHSSRSCCGFLNAFRERVMFIDLSAFYALRPMAARNRKIYITGSDGMQYLSILHPLFSFLVLCLSVFLTVLRGVQFHDTYTY